jgi:S1-C subfamily serine protease
MGWNFDDYQGYTEPEYLEPRRNNVTAILIGIGMGAVTLVLIMALVMTTVGYFLMPDDDTAPLASRGRQRENPIQADLRESSFSTKTSRAAQQVSTPTAIPPDVVQQADAEYLLLSNIYERVNPSVVNIEIVSRFRTTDVIGSSGSGFVINADGFIVTNAHVVRDAEEVLVTFYNGYVISADIIGIDDYSDLAVIRVADEDAPLMPVTLGDSNNLKVGQRIIAIGNPFGLEGSMTVGIVSALGRSLPSAELLDPAYQGYSNPSIIQIDAAVNPGNSGGPLLDSYGTVIGINTAIRTENGGFQGVAFAVPVNTLRRVVPQLIDKGYADYSWLGITTTADVHGFSMAALADELGFPVTYGVLINEVYSNSPAANAGLQGSTDDVRVRGITVEIGGDIIIAINGNMVRDIDDLVAYLVENTSPGDAVVLTIIRDGETFDVDVMLGTRPR